MSSLRTVGSDQLNFEQQMNELKSQWFWGALIVGLLVMQICMCTVAAILATQSGATDIVPEYYEQATQQEVATPNAVNTISE